MRGVIFTYSPADAKARNACDAVTATVVASVRPASAGAKPKAAPPPPVAVTE